WKCSDTTDLCEKSNKPINNTTPEGYTSHKICRLTCGEYAGLWPKPTLKTRLSKTLVEFHPSAVKFESDVTDEKYSKHLEKIKNIFLTNIYRECGDCLKTSSNEVIIRTSSQHVSTDLYFGIDESYVINSKQNENELHVNILSKTIYGVRHALETLSQIIVSNRISPHQPAEEALLVTVNSSTIGDRPIYLHRGLLLDTARNYLPKATIKRQLDAMAHSKMNVLHWHATDTQSFPLKLSSVPILAKYGAYSEKEVYTEHDITDLLAYAKYRGIRIILEIDGPAHAGNGWQWGPDAYLGKLAVCVNKAPWRNYCIQPPCGQLNPTNGNLYDILGQLYGDIIKLFPKGEMFHMGGDEV
ncbi:glycoside hydrolase, partial [Oryctes borbonicus]